MNRTVGIAEVVGAEITRYSSATEVKTNLRAELGDAHVRIEIKVEMPGHVVMTLEQVQALSLEMNLQTLSLLRQTND